MPLSIGDTLGPYEILAPLGAGGMGQVFLARDSRLRRQVAIKVLPRDKVGDPQSTRRVLQEARAASALNHPNIVTLYDIANLNGTDYLVMEYVPGKPLDKLITPKGLPLAEVLNYARQIASGLAAAHGAAIVHRDIKPGNVIVTPESQVKILDFGLAKLMERASGAEEETQTLGAHLTPLTEAGTVIGTVAYMSPEQATARPLDRRTDIFPLGVMLYEMLAGTRPFQRNSQVETLHAIIHDLAPPPGSVPPRLEEILERALEKDPKDRYQHAGDLALDLQRAERNAEVRPAAQIAQYPPTKSRTWISWSITGIAVASLLGILVWPKRGEPIREPIRFTFEPPENTALVRSNQDIALSPDGKRIALVLKDASGTNAIWIRPLDEQQSRKIEGTDDASSVFWSPDGQSLGFFAQGKLKRIALDGGPPQNICTTPPGMGASWSPAGEIVFNPTNRAPLMRVSAAGGAPQPLTALDSGRQENSHRNPSFLPDGRHFLFTARSSQKENTAIYVVTGFEGDQENPHGAIQRCLCSPRLHPVCEGWVADGAALQRRSPGIVGRGVPGGSDCRPGNTERQRVFYSIRRRQRDRLFRSQPFHESAHLVRPCGYESRNGRREGTLHNATIFSRWEEAGCDHSRSGERES